MENIGTVVIGDWGLGDGEKGSGIKKYKLVVTE